MSNDILKNYYEKVENIKDMLRMLIEYGSLNLGFQNLKRKN